MDEEPVSSAPSMVQLGDYVLPEKFIQGPCYGGDTPRGRGLEIRRQSKDRECGGLISADSVH
jgi:hypothetical protein